MTQSTVNNVGPAEAGGGVWVLPSSSPGSCPWEPLSVHPGLSQLAHTGCFLALVPQRAPRHPLLGVEAPKLLVHTVHRGWAILAGQVLPWGDRD